MAQVAIYCRLSNEDRNKQNEFDESESIQNQKSMLVGYCVEKGWDIYNIYCDEDYSGADSQRPDFLRMLEACEKNKVDIVLCKSQSRFSRDMEIIEKYLHNRFLEWGVRFISLVDHADTNDVGNKKARQINGLVNEWYLEELSDNIRKTLQNKRKNGEFTGSFAPYGYLKDPEDKNHLIIDDKTAPVVRNIFEWYVQGWGYRKITLRLNELGIPSPSEYKRQIHSAYKNSHERTSHSQGLWTTPTIFKLLRNETYTGTLVQGKTRHVSYKNHSRKPVDQDEWIRTPNSHDAILDIDLWNQAQERLKSRSRSSKITLEPSLLSSKVKCAVCGAPMKRNVYYNTDRSIKYYNLKCGTYKIGVMNCENQSAISGLQLENAILEQLNELIYNYCDADKIQIKT